MISRIIIGLLIAAFGFLVVWKTRNIIDIAGPISWADQHLGGGGTSLMYKMIGLVICLVGFMWATNLWTAFLNATLGAVLPK
jgi:hypothetical protein